MWFNIILLGILSFGYALANTNRPIIGIVAQEISSSVKEKFPRYSSYLAASYVKAIESSGAQVVPISVNKSISYYRNILRSINGVVLPGGGSKNGPGNPYYDTVKKIYTIAVELNDESIAFPILGVCLGFEFLIGVANGDVNILKLCNVKRENLPLKFIQPYKRTHFFSSLSEKQYRLLTTKNITANKHQWCALLDDFNKQPLLSENWVVTTLSMSFANVSKEFISSVEHKKYPFFGIQFHPEKTAFEWNREAFFDHSEEALIANRYFYDRFVHFARKNNQKFDDPRIEDTALIYNDPVIHAPEKYNYFTQIYFDPGSNSADIN